MTRLFVVYTVSLLTVIMGGRLFHHLMDVEWSFQFALTGAAWLRKGERHCCINGNYSNRSHIILSVA